MRLKRATANQLDGNHLPALYYLLNGFCVNVSKGKVEEGDFTRQKRMRRNMWCVGVCEIDIRCVQGPTWRVYDKIRLEEE